jgi:hypothetical protein
MRWINKDHFAFLPERGKEKDIFARPRRECANSEERARPSIGPSETDVL